MNILKYILLLIITTTSLISSNIKELEKKLEKVSGKEKFDVLFELSDVYFNDNPKLSLQYGLEMEKLAINMKSDSLKALSLYQLVSIYFMQGEYEIAQDKVEKCYRIVEHTNQTLFKIDILTYQGIIFNKLNMFDNALKAYKVALKIALKFNNKESISRIYNNLGNVYESLGEYENSISSYFTSLRYNNSLSDSNNFALTYTNIGKIYLRLENTKQALEIFNIALSFCGENYENGKGVLYNAIGAIYFKENNSIAIEYFQKALSLKNFINNKATIADILNNIGEYYRSKNEYLRAISYYKQAEEFNFKFHYQFGIANVNLNYAMLYLQKNELKKAKKYLELANKTISKSNFFTLKLELYEKYALYYKKKGDLNSTLEYKDKYIKLKDSISFVTRNQRLNTIYAQFKEDEHKEKLITLEKNQAIKELELSKKKTQIALLVVLTILLLLIIVLFLRRSKLKRSKELEVLAHNEQLTKLTDELQHKNEDLEILKADLEDSLQLQTEINETNKKLVNIIAHEYKTPMNYIQNALDLFVKTARKENFVNAESHIDNTIGMISKITNLLDQSIKISKSSSTKLNVEIEELKVNKYFNELIFDYFIDIDTQKHQFNLILLEEETSMFITPSVLDLVFHNLILNAVKYSPAGSQIDITLAKDKSNLIVSIKDQGIGIPLAEQSNLFVQNHRFSNVEEIKGSGFGLYLAKHILDEIKGSIEILSDTNKGTLINLVFPLDTRA